MRRTDAKWPLLAFGSAFWLALGLAGPVFQGVHGLTDLRPTLFFVIALPLWVLAIGALPHRDAGIATIGGFVIAALCSTFNIPLHVRALYWTDACEARDADACDAVASYYRGGFSTIGGFADAVHYEMIAADIRGKSVSSTVRSRIETNALRKACFSNDLAACSDWVDKGYYPEQKLACERILASCDDTACSYDTERCRIIVEPWYP